MIFYGVQSPTNNYSDTTFDLQKIIMKVLFLVAAIAVCLMTFAPATEASYVRRVSIYIT